MYYSDKIFFLWIRYWRIRNRLQPWNHLQHSGRIQMCTDPGGGVCRGNKGADRQLGTQTEPRTAGRTEGAGVGSKKGGGGGGGQRTQSHSYYPHTWWQRSSVSTPGPGSKMTQLWHISNQGTWSSTNMLWTPWGKRPGIGEDWGTMLTTWALGEICIFICIAFCICISHLRAPELHCVCHLLLIYGCILCTVQGALVVAFAYTVCHCLHSHIFYTRYMCL